LLYNRIGAGAGAAGAAGAASKFYPEPEPHKNDAAPQHCISHHSIVKYIYIKYQIGFDQQDKPEKNKIAPF
jgi:hypothetical protein